MKTLNDFERVTSQKFGNESKVKIPETKSCVGKSSVEFFGRSLHRSNTILSGSGLTGVFYRKYGL